MELHDPIKPRSDDKIWRRVRTLAESWFSNPNDFYAIHEAVSQSLPSPGTRTGHFAQLGWFTELERWVERRIRVHGLCLTGRFRQLNASPTFSLIRFETDGPAVWFKAVGAPNRREYGITLSLARSFSRFLPRVIATLPECNGWLSLEAPGVLLRESGAIVSWERAVQDLSQFQFECREQSANFLTLGARDLGLSKLAEDVKPFFRSMGGVMERQTKAVPAQLARKDLDHLSARIQDSLRCLEDTGGLRTLGPLDINPGNMVCSASGTVFLDWAEAFVGHPFLAYEFFLEQFRRAFGQHHPAEAGLLKRYITPWRSVFSESHLCRALNLTPLVAVFAYAVGLDAWRVRGPNGDSSTLAYLRSLTRRMECETHRSAERSLPCLD
jgi:hypothetical protein